MSVNRHLPHVFVLPEDDANRQLANGFYLDVNAGQLQVLREAGGWRKVCERFVLDHIAAMREYPDRNMVLLIDFDSQPSRLEGVRAHIPQDLRDRVFVLGVLSEPEELKNDLGTFEAIGRALAKDCRDGTSEAWGHDLLKHNYAEIARLVRLRTILFKVD